MLSHRADDFLELGDDLAVLIADPGGEHEELRFPAMERHFRCQRIAGSGILLVANDLLNNIGFMVHVFERNCDKGGRDKADKLVLCVSRIGGGAGEMAFEVPVIVMDLFYSPDHARSFGMMENSVDLPEGFSPVRQDRLEAFPVVTGEQRGH